MTLVRAKRLSFPGPKWVPRRTEEQADLPPSRSFAVLRPGDHLWNVVSVPTSLERPLLMELLVLGDVQCAIIKHRASRRLHFFVPMGTAEQWRVPGTQGMGAGAQLAVPFADVLYPVTSPYWLRPPRRAWMVDPDVLELAIRRTRLGMKL